MTILVTGASAGFGKAICRLLVREHFQVIGAARRREKLDALKAELGDSFYPLPMDVTDTAAVDLALQSLPENRREIDVLINNAGLALGQEPAYQTDFADWRRMIETNVIGLAYVTHRILPQMAARRRGYIINLGSVAGDNPYPGSNVYGATKAFVKQFSRNLRSDLAGTGIRVSNIAPGLAGDTEFSPVRYKGDMERARRLYENVAALRPEDIAETVLWLLRLPAHVNINFIEMMPVAQSWSALTVTRTPPEIK